MKPLSFFLLLCISPFLSAQQTAFKVAHDDMLHVSGFASSLAEIFENPASRESLTISPEELKNAPLYDFSKLEKLAEVQVQFTMDPDAGDSAKTAFTDSIAVWMKNMSYFSKCPKLKRVIFHIGERIYLNTKQCAFRNKKEERNYQAYYKRTSDENLTAAWNSFGKDVHVLLPGVELYAYTWGW